MGQVIHLFSREVIADEPRIAKQSLLEILENSAFYALDITRLLPNLQIGPDWGEAEWEGWKDQQLTTLNSLREQTGMYAKGWEKDPTGYTVWDRLGGCTEFRPEYCMLVKLCQPKLEDEGNVHTIYGDHNIGSLMLDLTEKLTFVSDQAKAAPPHEASEQDRAVWMDNVYMCFEQTIRMLDMAIEKIESAVWGEGGDAPMDTFTIVNEDHPEAEDMGLIGHNENALGMMEFAGADIDEMRAQLGINIA